MSDKSIKHKMSDPIRIITLANGLSVLRAFLSLPIIYCLAINSIIWAMTFIFIAVLTDLLDGFFARRAHEVTTLGKVLDPAADSIVILSVILFITLDESRNFPFWFLVFYIVRYLAIALIAVYILNHYSTAFGSNILGKWTITMLTLSIILYVIRIESFGFYCLLITTVLAVMSWFQYLSYHIEYLRNRAEEK